VKIFFDKKSARKKKMEVAGHKIGVPKIFLQI